MEFDSGCKSTPPNKLCGSREVEIGGYNDGLMSIAASLEFHHLLISGW